MKLYKNADQYYLFRPLDKPFIERYFKTSGRRNSAFSEVKVYKCESQASIIDELQPDDSQYLKEVVFSRTYGFGTISIITKVAGPHDKVTNLRSVAAYLAGQPMGNLEVKLVSVKIIDNAEIAAIQNYFAQLDVIENLETTGALRIPHQKLDLLENEYNTAKFAYNKVKNEREVSKPRIGFDSSGCKLCHECVKFTSYTCTPCIYGEEETRYSNPVHDCPIVQEWNKNNPPTQRELTLEEEYNKIRKNYGEYIERYHADKKQLIQSMQPIPPL